MKVNVIISVFFILILTGFVLYGAEQKLPNCDLGAEMINYEIMKQIDAQTVHVKITGRVKNLGSKDFQCEKGQTVALLSEGSRTPENTFTVVVEKEILAIPVGEFFDLAYERDFEIADLDKFDSQPNYRLEIKYSPALLQGGNTDNDDSVAKNNIRTRTSKQLRRIWAAYPRTGAKPVN